MKLVHSSTPRPPAESEVVIAFPPRVRLACAACDPEYEGWVGGFVMTDGAVQIVARTGPGGPTHYALIAKMHELATQHGVELHIQRPNRPVEVLGPIGS